MMAVEAVGISCNLIFGSLHVAHAASVQFIAFASNLVCYYLIISFFSFPALTLQLISNISISVFYFLLLDIIIDIGLSLPFGIHC